MPRVTLVPFTDELLPTVQSWFTDAQTRRWLGGPDWPARSLALRGHGLGEQFRGRRVLGDHTWVALDAAGRPVALTGGDVYDRWCRYRETPGGPVVDRVEPGPALGMAYAVDPARRRQGYGVATLLATVAAPEVADVVVFALGVEPENVAGVRCATAAGFRPDDAGPDWEGIVHHVLRR